MFVCQWHLDIPYRKQGEVVRIMKTWGEEKLAASDFRRARSTRLLVGRVGESAAHIMDEFLFDPLADFESALQDMAVQRFREHSDALAPHIVPGSQRWVVWRVLE